MPALLERLLQPASVPASPAREAEDVRESGNPAPADKTTGAEKETSVLRICSACYLTEAELNRTGLLGCARCYETFAPVIAAATEVLHGVRVPPEWAQPKPRHTVTNPWPTRRGIRIGPK